MSFALEFRKQRLTNSSSRSKSREAAPKRRASHRKTKRENDTSTLTGRQVAAALLIAGIVLSVFNSGALVQYAGGLADRVHGPVIISVSERWHALMELGRMNRLSERVRAAVSTARHSSWQDVARQLGMAADDQIGEAKGAPQTDSGAVSSIPGRYGDQPAKPIRRTSADQSG